MDTALAIAPRDRFVCFCCAVKESVVLTVVRDGARDVGTITDRCDAGSGCGRCRPVLQSLLDRTAA